MTIVGCSPAMPTRRAIAAAVRPLSPVMTMMRMPARRQAATASATSGRGGSSIATSPRKHSSRSASSRISGSGSGAARAALGDGEHAQPLPRVARRRNREISARSAGPSGRSRPSVQITVEQRGSSASGAPLASTHRSPSRSSTVDISLSTGSKWNCGGGRGRARRNPRPRRGRPRRPASPAPSDRRSRSWPARARWALLQAAIARRAGRATGALPRAWSAALEVERLRRSPDRGDAHPVLGQRAGLVGADHVRRAERLDGAQALDHRAAAHQLANADRERERDHRQQALRHVAHEQADREHHRIGDRAGRRANTASGTNAAPVTKAISAISQATCRTCVSSGLSSRSTRSDSAAMRPSSVCIPVANDERSRGALRAGRAREHQLAGLEQRHLGVQHVRGAERRQRLAAERRQVDLDAPGEQSRVRRDAVALLDHQHVSWHQPRGLDRLLLLRRAAPSRSPAGSGQRLDRSLGLQLLGEREARVDQDHHDDRDGDRDDPRRPGQRRGDPEEQRERVDELRARAPAAIAARRAARARSGPNCTRRRSASRDESPEREARRSRSSRSTCSVGSTAPDATSPAPRPAARALTVRHSRGEPSGPGRSWKAGRSATSRPSAHDPATASAPSTDRRP